MEKAKFIRVHVKESGRPDSVKLINIDYVCNVHYQTMDPTHRAIIELPEEKWVKVAESFEDIEKMLDYSCGVIGRIPESDELMKELLNRIENT